jgi:hypothetical protein
LIFALAIAVDHQGLANRVAIFVSGSGANPNRPRRSIDRFWAVLPLSLSCAGFIPVLDRVAPTTVYGVGLVTIFVYYAAMIRLAWIYTPKERRRRGPLFWTMRAAAIPLAGFFAYGLITALLMNVL